MCAMPDPNMAPAIRESHHADFSHGLQDLCTLQIAPKNGPFVRYMQFANDRRPERQENHTCKFIFLGDPVAFSDSPPMPTAAICRRSSRLGLLSNPLR